MGKPTLKDWEAFVEKVAREKGLDEKTAAIHAAPGFYVRFGIMPGDLK